MRRIPLVLIAGATLMVHALAAQNPLPPGGIQQRFPVPASEDDSGYQLMSEVIDDDPVGRRFDGLIGVQVHVGPPMKVEYRSVRLKQL